MASIFGARMAAAQGTSTQAPAAPEVKAPPAAAAPPTPPPPPTKVEGKLHPAAPPWARTDCMACRIEGLNTGVSTVGDACLICRQRQNKEGKISPDWFTVGYSSVSGEVSWEVREDRIQDAQAVTQNLAGSIPAPFVKTPGAPKTTSKKPTPAPSEKAPEIPQAAPAPPTPPAASTPAPVATPTPPAAPSAPPAPETQKAKKIKFTLLIDATPRGGVNGVIRADALLAKYGAELAVEEKVESFWQINAFRRRDLLAAHVEEIAEKEGLTAGKYVVASRGSPDHAAFAEALAGIAHEVIVGYSS